MAKARAKSDSATKRKLLDAAMKLMVGKGFRATTVDDICAEAGLTKGSFFHYFDSKEDLARAAAKHFHECQQRMFDGADFRSVADPLERVYGRLDFVASLARNPQLPKSCLIGNLAQEVSGTHEGIRCVCEDIFDSAATDFERDLAAAKLKHAPDADFDPAGVGRLYISLIQGSMIMAKASRNPAVVEENVEHLRRYIKCLFGRTRAGKKESSSNAMAYDEHLADRIRHGFNKARVRFEEKRMMGGLCFLVDGKMCVGAEKNLLMARIDPAVYESALGRKGCVPMDFTGRPMRGFVFVKPEGVTTDAALDEWLGLALEFNPRAKASRKNATSASSARGRAGASKISRKQSR